LNKSLVSVPRFICFTGIDGSGKSTLASLLVSTLRQNGIESKFVYSRYKPMLARPLLSIARLLFLHGENPFKDYDRYVNVRKSAFSNGAASRAYEYVMLVDYVMQVLIKVKLSLAQGITIVCDRYIYDTIINDMLDNRHSTARIETLLDKLFLILPRPNIAFLVDVPEEIAYKRKDDVPSMDYLKIRRPLFLSIASSQGLVVLDGTQNLRRLKHDIMEVLTSDKIRHSQICR
jgi:thymidylate kinase